MKFANTGPAERYDVFEILLALGWFHCFPTLASQT